MKLLTDTVRNVINSAGGERAADEDDCHCRNA
jgi:hypothetical protein